MKNVVVTGWKTGFRKVSMTKLIRAYTGYDLARGKHCVDEILDGKVVVLTEISAARSESLIVEADRLGANCHLETSEVSFASLANVS